MKISKASNTKQTSSVKKNNPSKSGEFAKQVRGSASTDNIDSGQASEGVSALGSLDSILAAQEVSDSTDGPSKGVLVQYGEQLLNYLDEIK